MHKMNLQLFAEPGAANSGTGDPAPTQPADPVGTGNGAPDAGTPQIDPAKVDEIAAKKAEQAQRAALRSYFQQQGMTETEAEAAIKAYKDQKAAQDEKDKGNLTAMQKKAEEAEKRVAAVEASAFSDLVEAKSEALAVSLGIDPAKLAYIRLDFSKVGKTDTGKPKAEDIKAVLEGALKVMPELKRTSEPIQTGVAPTNGGKPITGDDDAIRRAMGLPPKK